MCELLFPSLTLQTDYLIGSVGTLKNLRRFFRRCANLSIAEDGVPIAKIDQDLQEIGKKKLEMSLVGKIVTNREIKRTREDPSFALPMEHKQLIKKERSQIRSSQM
ncbi:hypothetical protein ACOSQ3_014164 [Xanthoceras sorbifolium]